MISRLRRPIAVWHIFAILSVSLLALARASAAEEAAKSFDVPAGNAEQTLKQFSAQAGVQLAFATDVVQGVRTNPVRGVLSAATALEKMLEGTPLKIVRDATPGAFAIRRETPSEKNAASPAAAASPSADGQIVQLAGVEVTANRDTGVVNQGVIPRAPNEALRFEIMNRRDIERSGATNLSELFFRQVPSITSAGTGTQRTFAFAPSFSTGFGTTTDAVNFRGLGTNRTLTLVNGRRLYAGEAAGTDVSRFPIAAIDRIEILPSSASAIYGGNAVGGIVNVILRKDYQGGELRTYVGAPTGGGAAEIQTSFFHGLVAPDGKTRISVSLDYVHKDALLASDRTFFRRALTAIAPSSPGFLTDIIPNFVGSTATLSSSNNTSLGITGSTATFASVPGGSSGAALRPDDFAGTAGKATVSEQRQQRGVLLPASTTYSGFLVLERSLNQSGLEGYVELGFRYSQYGAAYPGFVPTITLSATNPLNPFRAGVTPGFVGRAVRVFVDPIDLPDARTDSLQRAFRTVAGIKHQRPEQNWRWSADLSWDRTDSRATTADYLRFLATAVNAGIYNPLRDLSTAAPQPDTERAKYASYRYATARPEITAANVRVNGEVWQLPGGPLAASIGSEARFETDQSANTYTYGAYSTLPGVSLTASSATKTFRRVVAGFSEATLPVFGKPNARPGLQKLELSAAARYESFDDFGSALSPMAALKYEPWTGVVVRGSYGRGFLPPPQSSLFAPIVTSPAALATFVDPRRPGQSLGPITQTSGGNPGLKGESTESIDVGVVLQPAWWRGLTLSASYYHYDTSDRIATPTLQNIIDWEALFPGRVQRAAPTAADTAASRPGMITGVDRTQLNVARIITDGFDFQASYRQPTESLGTFEYGAGGTMGRSFRTQSVAGAAFADTRGDIGDGRSTYPPLRLRGRVALRWERGAYAAGWTGRYTSEYLTNSTRPTVASPTKTGYDGVSINLSFEMDLQLTRRVAYSNTAGQGWRRWFGGTQWTLGCLNVLDQKPPYITTFLGWYSLFSDPRGRFVYLEVKKSL